MIRRPRRSPPAVARPERSVRRSILALVVTAAVAFGLVATGSVLVARRIARDDVLAEALRSAPTVANAVFVPVLAAVISGDRQAVGLLDRAVRIRSRDGSLVRVKVWAGDGTVIYSDAHSLLGKSFPASPHVHAAIAEQQDSVELSELKDAENLTEVGTFDRLVEVYIPLTLDDGTRVAFEMYSTDARLKASENRLISELVPFALGALLVLLLTQLPVAVWLVRRVGHAQKERGRLLASSLAASERERRNIARDLHDGVVQDLAGAGYGLGAVTRSMPPDTTAGTRHLLEMSCAAVQRSVHDLRTLMVDIHPPDLTADGLENALRDLGGRLRDTAAIEVDVRVAPPAKVDPEVAALLYRCTRECLTNIAKHAAARHAIVQLTGDAVTVRLEVTDDGRGLPPGGFDRRAEGHVGLVLLADATRDLGGQLTVTSGVAGGTTVLLVLPTRDGGQGWRPAGRTDAHQSHTPSAHDSAADCMA